MAKNIKPASEYAPPHKMSGEKTSVATYQTQKSGKERIDEMNISVGGISKGNYSPVNPYGVGEMRGYGAATKGRKTSGKMG